MSMDRIPRYKQTEAMILGIIVPLALAIYTAHLALNDEAVFWGRSSTVIYHGSEAYFVSLLWFGLSALMCGHFLLRHYRLLSTTTHNIYMWTTAICMVIGLVSAVVFI
ncbi:hypothetical protein NEJAP_2062 [Neptunomonas japonica JAMM 1380]|uniref:Uncharacterized protein n=1 Tax=Neptunomonas japonica JAMM 1380 TaxID=1441457 RepID=A0A7R6PKQ1_9GAMM|nr:hypothetical protein NEJAP_2062 [Neptunomonas japonica JAMM 1380]